MNVQREQKSLHLLPTSLVLALGATNASAVQLDITPDQHIDITGYVREWLAMNLQNHPELSSDGTPIGGRGQLSMARSTALLQLQTQLGPTHWVAIGRFSKEAKTNYLDELEDASRAKGLPIDLMDKYNANELRELYMDADPTERLHLRLGKQQVVWGETDFFQAMDVIHGYDNSIVQFQAENEEWRKPLWLLNAEYSMPNLDGVLQLIVRPGLDSGSDMGNTYDLFGGRWAAQPNKGTNTLAIFPYNYHHSKGDEDNASYGGRWTGIADSVSYSLNYYHTMQQEPVLNVASNPYGQRPRNGIGEFIFPEVDIFGATASGSLGAGAWRSEVAYTRDKPYNFGFVGTPSAGAAGVKEKDTIRLMAGYDVPLRSIGPNTSTPTNLSLQLFDTWLVDYKRSDQITESTARRKEHSLTGTALFSMNFLHDRITPSIVLIHDISYGGGLVIPGIEYKPGNHWRIKTEAYIFYKSQDTCSALPNGKGYGCNHTFGGFDNNDQLVARITYQF